MKNDIGIRRKAYGHLLGLVLLGLVLLATPGLAAQAALTDLSDTPLVNDAGLVVRPNMMFVLDNSGSMDFNFTPDNVSYDASNNNWWNQIQANRGNRSGVCRVHDYVTWNGDVISDTTICGGANSSGTAPTDGGDPPFYSAQFNTSYYNPAIRYSPPPNPCNPSQTLPSMTDWTEVLVQGHAVDASCVQTAANGKVNLLTQYPERVYCSSAGSLVNSDHCKRNGIDDTNRSNGDYDFPTSAFYNAKTLPSHPHYYSIEPTQYCSDSSLTSCGSISKGRQIPAYVRYCKGVSSTTCQAKFDSDEGYINPQFGNFIRHNIIPSITSYPKAAGRDDCSGATCTYAEEMTNFANWYAYYRTRMQTMKSAAGQAFSTIDDALRVGFVTINPGNSVDSSQYLPIADFNSTQKTAWYQKFYSINPSGGTPLREALSRVGRHYANVTGGINEGMAEDPVQYECQQNFTLLTTDGYWNGASGDKIDGSSIGNQDNVNADYSTRAVGAFDGNLSGSSDTLADVAMYYYKTDLRPGMPDKVPTNDKDTAPHQHMVTFTLGLGLDGLLNYRPDYETATTGDFANIKTRTGEYPNWPAPDANEPSALDDLWHAAVNGRGIYFSAEDPNTLTSGIQSTLGSMVVKVGSAAASATSSPNITPSDNFIYSSTYRTGLWDGEVVAKTLDTQTGEVSEAETWSTDSTMTTGSNRIIYKMNMPAAASNPTIEVFSWENLNTAERNYFSNKCSLLSQCNLLDEATRAVANNGSSLLEYLKGAEFGGESETTAPFRTRQKLLGDTVNATPAFVKAPRFNFADDGYGQFKSDNAERQGMLYVAANDGMLHALNADTGVEQWAYVPNIVLQDLYHLADKNYAGKHRYYIDGTPTIMDVQDGATWKTILVGGLNGGGRGYYALDITNPASPQPLWEFCYDSTYCNVADADLGFTYGNPVIAKMPVGSAHAGKWVVMVTSGYNNVSPGDGQGRLYVLDASTGAILEEVSTGTGSTDIPSGLAKISAWADNGNLDATATYVYGGDLLGNVWRFNLQTATASASKLATLAIGGVAQPVTTKPELGKVKNINDRIVYVGTGKYLGVSDITDTTTQSIYAIRDSGTTVNGRSLTPRTITQSGVTASVAGDAVDWANGGWYADLPESKERVNIDPQLVLGTLLVATSTPIGNTCSPGGTSWIYQFDFATGLNVVGATSILGNKQTSGLVVGIVVFRLPNGQLKGVATTGDGTQDTFGVHTNPAVSGAKRTGWRELMR